MGIYPHTAIYFQFIFNLFSRLTCESICKWYFEYVDKIKSVFVYKDVCTDDCLFIEPALVAGFYVSANNYKKMVRFVKQTYKT